MKSLADDFISSNLLQFGINGSNTVKKTPSLQKEPIPIHQWSKENHYGFGYNGELFNHRRQNGDVYQVRYDQSSFATGLLKEEMILTLDRFCKENGPLGLPGHGGTFSKVASEVCREANLPFKIVQLNVKNMSCAWPYEGDCEYERLDTTLSDLERFFAYFNDYSSCVDTRILFDAYAGFRSEYAYVYDTHIGLQFTDFNFDAVQSRFVGPANWCLVDAEKRTAICRFLNILKRPGLVDFFHHSPDLMRSYILHPQFLKLISAGGQDRGQDNFANHERILAQTIPWSAGEPDLTALNPELANWLKKQEGLLLSQTQWNCRDIWTTPLDCFIREWRLPLQASVLEDAYGTVF